MVAPRGVLVVVSQVMAVQFEHEKNRPDVARVLLEVAMAVTARDVAPAPLGGSSDQASSSPFYKPDVARKFGTGDFESLCTKPKMEGLDVLKALRQFHEKCYKPENMTIAIRYGLSTRKHHGCRPGRV